MLELSLLGLARVRLDGRDLRLATRKAMVLLAVVAASRTVARQQLCALLWPELDEPSARRNLRRELARLREAGLSAALAVDGDRVALSEQVQVDLHDFEKARHDDPRGALALWGGAFADGMEAGDSPELEDWLVETRKRLHDAWRDTVARAAEDCERAGDSRLALRHVLCLLDDDPLHEHHHRLAMRLHAALGEGEAALARYELCRTVLEAELGLAPMPQTTELMLAIRGDAVAPARAAPARADRAGPLLPETLPFVGRADEAGALDAAWDRHCAVLITGPAGVGKTRLATDFAAAHGPFASIGCRSGDGGVAYGSFTRALRSLVAAGGLPEAPWLRTELARLLPDAGEAPPPLTDETQRLRFYEACVHSWVDIAADNFGAVIVDDLHLADAASAELFIFLAQRLHDLGAESSPPRLLFTLRAEEMSVPLAAQVQSVLAEDTLVRVALSALTQDEVFDLVQRLSQAGSPRRFASRLHRATGGNAFFLHETLRHLVSSGWIHRDAGGEWSTAVDEITLDYAELPLPASVVEAALARIRRSGEAVTRTLEAASLAEEPFDAATLAGCTALTDFELADALERAEAAQLIVAIGPAFRFAHDLLRQTCAGSLSEVRRRLIQSRLALAGEARHADAARIAAHWEAAGQAPRAVPWLLRAGALANERLATLDAIDLFERALAAGATGRDALEAHRALAALHRRNEDAPAALASAGLALAAARTLGDDRLWAQVEVEVADLEAFLNRSAEALARVERLRLRTELPAATRAKLEMASCAALRQLGRSDESQACAEAALALLDVAGSGVELDTLRRDALNALATSAHLFGDLRAGLEYGARMRDICVRIGDEHGRGRAETTIGVAHMHGGNLAEARLHLQNARRITAAAFDVQSERMAILNLMKIVGDEGDAEGLLRLAHEGWNLSPRFARPFMRQAFLNAFCYAHCLLGDLGSALDAAESIRDDARRSGEFFAAQDALLGTADLYVQLGDAATPRAMLDALPRDADPQDQIRVKFGFIRAQLLIEAGEPTAAGRELGALGAPGAMQHPEDRVTWAQRVAAVALAAGDLERAHAALESMPRATNTELAMAGLTLRLRLHALACDRPAAGAAPVPNALDDLVAESRAALARAGAPACFALELREALAACLAATGQADEATAEAHLVRRRIDELADSLRGHPSHRASFLARHAGAGQGSLR